jgi:hypothetical protein
MGECPRRIKMKVQNLIYKMLTESTGIHMMDSGGGEGRHWQRNQKKTLKDFTNEPEVDIDAENVTTSEEVDFTVSVFHYLNRYELDEVCDYFNRLQCKNWENIHDIYGVSEAQLDKLAKRTTGHYSWSEAIDSGDIINHGAYNTYNGDCPLSQTLQGAKIEILGDSYEFIQVHQGADVRGGYTDAKLFKYPKYADFMSWDVYGSIDGVDVDTRYNGYSLTDDNGNSVPVKPDSKIELYLGEM